MSDSKIFKAAVKLSPDQRTDYLEQACGNDQALRREVDSLLRAHEPDSFLEKPAGQPSPKPLVSIRVEDLRSYLGASFSGVLRPAVLSGSDAAELSATEKSVASLLDGGPDSELNLVEADALIFWMARLLGVVRVHRAYPD